MKISQITVQSVLGAKDVYIKATAPVVVIAGDNYSGKSSTREAIYQVMANQAVRAELKKDYVELVSDGVKKGSATVNFDGGSGSIILPKGAHSFSFDGVSQSGVELMQLAIPYCLGSSLLAEVAIEDRRRFLMKLMNVRAGVKDILARLIEEKADEKKANEIVAFLPAGYPAAINEAQGKAREKKALWKALTRENWGIEKSAEWSLEYTPSPEIAKIDIKALERQIGDQNKALETLTGELSALRAEQKTYADVEQKRASFKAFADTLPFAEEALGQDILSHTNYEKEVIAKRELANGAAATITYSCPCCAVLLEKVGDKLIEYVKPEQVADEDAKAQLPVMEQKLKSLALAIEVSQSAVESAKNAIASLAVLPEKTDANYEEAIRAKSAEVDAAKLALVTSNSTKSSFDESKASAESAKKKTSDAKALHDNVVEYLKIADLLSPSGIPAKLLADAIAPFNEALAQSAQVSYWLTPSVDGDMNVYYGGRSYHLCSESEKWRCDAMIAEVVAKFSKLKFIMLDRFDCLNSTGRADMIAWLRDITADGAIETAIVFGTMKDKPVLPKDCQLVWMSDGTSEDWEYIANSGGAPRWELKERAVDETGEGDRIAA